MSILLTRTPALWASLHTPAQSLTLRLIVKRPDEDNSLNSRRPLKLMMTPACPRLLDMINDFVLLRF